MKQQILDASGKIVGYIIKNGNTTEITDFFGRILGRHNAGTDYVTDHMGKIVGKGIELLGTLIKR